MMNNMSYQPSSLEEVIVVTSTPFPGPEGHKHYYVLNRDKTPPGTHWMHFSCSNCEYGMVVSRTKLRAMLTDTPLHHHHMNLLPDGSLTPCVKCGVRL